MRFEITFNGHENIRSLHPKTIEITKDPSLTINGDCIVGVNADYACNDIPDKMKSLLQNSNSQVSCIIIVGDLKFKVSGRGNENLTLTDPHDIVIRKSSFTCPRTLATSCNAASDSVPRQIIRSLQNPETKGVFVIEVS